MISTWYMIRDVDKLHFSTGMLHRFSEGSRSAIRGSSVDLCNTENVCEWMRNCSHLIEDEYWHWRSICAVRLVLRLSPRPGQPFCYRRLKETCCKPIYVSRCNTATAFSGTLYCRDHQLSWLRFTSGFKFMATWLSPFPYKFMRGTYLDSFAPIHAEKPSMSHRDLCPPAAEKWRILWKDVSYSCHIPYLMHFKCDITEQVYKLWFFTHWLTL